MIEARVTKTIPTWQIEATETSDLIQRYISAQIRLVYAAENIIAVSLLAAHPWCWNAIGFTEWRTRT